MTDRIGVLAEVKSRSVGESRQYYVVFKATHDDKMGFVTEANMPSYMNKFAEPLENQKVRVNLNFDRDEPIVTDVYKLEQSVNNNVVATHSPSY